MTCQGPACSRPANATGLCEAHRRQQLRGRDLAPLRYVSDPALCPTCSEAEWLGLAGEAFEQIAARLHLTPESLTRHLQRHLRDDLLARITRLADVRPTPFRY